MIGYTREASNSELLRTDFKGFSVPTTLGVYKQDLANTRTIRRERTSSSAIGILTRVNYNYKSTYYANFTFRRDGYSAFSAGNKWGNFYGASAAWVLSNENFVKDNADWLDYLKLRFSWGQNGSRPFLRMRRLVRLEPLILGLEILLPVVLSDWFLLPCRTVL